MSLYSSTGNGTGKDNDLVDLGTAQLFLGSCIKWVSILTVTPPPPSSQFLKEEEDEKKDEERVKW